MVSPRTGNLLLFLLLLKVRRDKKRRFGVHPINKKRKQLGAFHQLFQELKDDEERFKRYVRIGLNTFQLLHGLLKKRLTKHSKREPISSEQRLVVTLRFLATGESFRSLAFQFRMGFKTVAVIVQETSSIIYEVLQPRYLQAPTTTEEWARISQDFWLRWNCPNTLGCIDGKHVLIKKPANSGSLYFNYKGTFSIVFMAVCDSRYRIIYGDIGAYGHESDGGIFDRSDFNTALKEGRFPLPEPAVLRNSNVVSPFFFIGDAAFPLMKNLMKPLPGVELTDEKRIYNYRICRGRRVIENTFGIMCAMWRVLLKQIETSDEVANSIVKACCVLHNFLIDEGSLNAAAMADTGQANEPNGLWRLEVQHPLQPVQMRRRGANRSRAEAEEVRQNLVRYFNQEGAVEWQNGMV